MLKTISAIAAAGCLLVCVWTPVAFFQGALEKAAFQWAFGLASAGWFVCATAFVSLRTK